MSAELQRLSDGTDKPTDRLSFRGSMLSQYKNYHINFDESRDPVTWLGITDATFVMREEMRDRFHSVSSSVADKHGDTESDTSSAARLTENQRCPS